MTLGGSCGGYAAGGRGWLVVFWSVETGVFGGCNG